MAVVPNFGVTQDVGEFLRHERSDLLHRRAQLQVAQVQARRQGLPAPPVIRQLLLSTAGGHAKLGIRFVLASAGCENQDRLKCTVFFPTQQHQRQRIFVHFVTQFAHTYPQNKYLREMRFLRMGGDLPPRGQAHRLTLETKQTLQQCYRVYQATESKSTRGSAPDCGHSEQNNHIKTLVAKH